MRVRQVDSDAIKLYEPSQVKFKTTRTIREVQFSAGVNKSCAIQNISKDTFPDKTAGEMKERNHNTNRYQYMLMQADYSKANFQGVPLYIKKIFF